MSKLSPIESQSPSKENDSIDEQQRKAATSHDEDEFDDSLNVSISEHISEEIESNLMSSVAEDSIDKATNQFDQNVMEKKRKLFNFDDSDISDAVDNNGIRKFTKFDASDGKFDEFLSGDNIAKHFKIECEPNATKPIVSERVQSVSSGDNIKIDVSERNVSGDDGAAHSNIFVTSTENNSKSNKDDINDVIMINDHEISLTSLKQMQKQRSNVEIEQSTTNQNTTSDISDLLNSDKEQKSIEDVSGISANESQSASSKRESKSKSKSSNENESNHQDEEMQEVEVLQKCKPILVESSAVIEELSIIEEVSAVDEPSSNRNRSEHNFDKVKEVRKIVNDAIDQLPLEKENRPPNLHEELLSAGSKQLTSSQNSTTTDATVYNAFGKMAYPFDVDPNFESELNLNLVHMQNKIKELQNLSSGKYAAIPLDLAGIGRRDSLIDSVKDFPQSGRESTSITTNSTEYRPFQDEYFRVSKHMTSIHGLFLD